MRAGIVVIAVIFALDLCSSARDESTTDQSSFQYPYGDVRNCPTQRLDGDGSLSRVEVLPGAGFDNLRNMPMGEVHEYTYNKCMISRDGRFLLPDNVLLVPVQESKLEVFAEVFEHWHNYTSVNSKSINTEVSIFFSLISGSGGSRNLERGVQLRVHEAHPKIFGLPRPLPDVNAHVIIVATYRISVAS